MPAESSAVAKDRRINNKRHPAVDPGSSIHDRDGCTEPDRRFLLHPWPGFAIRAIPSFSKRRNRTDAKPDHG